MRRVPAWITADGLIFTDQHSAKRHADERYGALVLKLAHEAACLCRYKAAGDWIEANLPRFLELEALRLDCEIINEIEED